MKMIIVIANNNNLNNSGEFENYARIIELDVEMYVIIT